MAQARRIETAPGAARAATHRSGTPQQEQFRDSLHDAFDGIDVADLQSRRAAPPLPPAAPMRVAAPPLMPAVPVRAAAPVRPAAPPPRPPAPALPTERWTPGRAMAPVSPVLPGAASLTEQRRAELDAATAPLRAEIAALRADVARLRGAADDPQHGRRSDMLTLGGLLLVALLAGVALALLLHH